MRPVLWKAHHSLRLCKLTACTRVENRKGGRKMKRIILARVARACDGSEFDSVLWN